METSFADEPRRTGSIRPLLALVVLLLLAGAALFLGPLLRDRRIPGIDEDTAERLAGASMQPRQDFGRRLEPRGDRILHGAGQTDSVSFEHYSDAVAPARPTLFMTYVDLRDDLPAFFEQLRHQLAAFDARSSGTSSPTTGGGTSPATVLPQIGLALNRGDAHRHYEAAVAQGGDDPALDRLCDGLRSLGRPAFLRIGYEFNGPWNGYQPTPYIAAFRRITAHLRGCGLEQVATVWDWSADAEGDAETAGAPAADPGGPPSRWSPFYPGDDAVDWWGLNLFQSRGISAAATARFVEAAARSGHPVMIGESAPQGFVNGSSPWSAADAIKAAPTVPAKNTAGETPAGTSASSWAAGSTAAEQRALKPPAIPRLQAPEPAVIRQWYAPFFGLIHSSPPIKAFCYIDWDWRGYPQWAGWGDSRIENDPAVLAWYRRELAEPAYLHASAAAATTHTPPPANLAHSPADSAHSR